MKILSFQVEDLIKTRLDILVEGTRKSQSEYMRTALKQLLNKNKDLISSIENSENIEHLVPEKHKDVSKSLGSLTTYDRAVIKSWENAYNLSNTRVFAPPIKTVLNKLRKEGFSQSDILTLVSNCRKSPMVRKLEQMSGAKAPPLSSILSAKMVPHLLFLLEEDIVEDHEDIEDYKRVEIDNAWQYIPDKNKDQFREEIMACTCVEAIEACGDKWAELVKND